MSSRGGGRGKSKLRSMLKRKDIFLVSGEDGVFVGLPGL